MSAKIWVLFAIVGIARSRDIIVGSNDIGHKIYDENKQAGPAVWRQMENVTITANDTEVISKIVITDLRADKDGDAKIVEGGEGHRNVTIELKSPTVLRGYEFHIEAYAVAEDQLKTMGQNSGNTGTNKPEEQPSAATPNAGVTTSVNLDKQLTTTTIASPTNDASINRRQNRDTENKDMSTQEIKNITPSLTSTAGTTEISKEPLANSPTSTTQKPDQKFPVVNREFHHGLTFDHPRVNIYEVNRAQESTARSIPSANVKSEENIHTQGQTNLNADKLHTHISYPQFGVDDSKQTPQPVVNTASPFVEEDKNKNVRHRREATNPADENKGIQKPIGIENTADTSKTNPLNSQAQKHGEEHIVRPGTVVTSTSYNPASLENQRGQDIAEKSQRNKHSTFRDRYLHRRFGNTAATDAPSISSSTENNKISTPLPKINDSTQTVGTFIYSQPGQLGKELSGSTTISNVNKSTAKSGSTTESLPDPAPKVIETDETKTEKPHDSNVRHTRDTTSVTNKGISESLLPPVLRSSSTTLKPEIKPKNAQETNLNSTDAQPILGNAKVSEDKSSTDGTSKSTATDSPLIVEEDRNTRDTIGTDEKKGNDKLPNDKKDSSISSRTIKPVSTFSEHRANEPTHTKESEKVPIESKSENSSKQNSAKDAITESKIGEDKERQTRDTKAVDESKDSKKEPSEGSEPTEPKTKSRQRTKLDNEKSPNLENKSTPSSTVDDKLAKHDDNDAHKRVQIPVWNKEDQEEASKVNNSEHDDQKGNQQSPKIPREAKETEGSKKSNDVGHPRDISLPTDLKIVSTENPTSVNPIHKDNKEKDLKKTNNEDISKPTQKPE